MGQVSGFWPRGLYKRLQVGEAPVGGASDRGVSAAGASGFRSGSPRHGRSSGQVGQVVGEAPASCCVLRGVGRRGKVSWVNCGGDPHLSPTTGPCG